MNSSTASWMTGAIEPVTLGSLLSTPSTVKLLFRGRLPPIDPPSPTTPPAWVVVPGREDCEIDRIAGQIRYRNVRDVSRAVTFQLRRGRIDEVRPCFDRNDFGDSANFQFERNIHDLIGFDVNPFADGFLEAGHFRRNVVGADCKFGKIESTDVACGLCSAWRRFPGWSDVIVAPGTTWPV